VKATTKEQAKLGIDKAAEVYAATLPDGTATGTAPAAAGADAAATTSQSIRGTIKDTLLALSTGLGTQAKAASILGKQKLLPEARSITTLNVWDIVPNSERSCCSRCRG